jgi:hypothetical protein
MLKPCSVKFGSCPKKRVLFLFVAISAPEMNTKKVQLFDALFEASLLEQSQAFFVKAMLVSILRGQNAVVNDLNSRGRFIILFNLKIVLILNGDCGTS